MSECLWVPTGEIHNVSVLKDRYTFDPKYDNLSPVPAYRERNGYFGFPRHADIQVNTIENKTVNGLDVNLRFLGALRNYQVPVIDKVMAKLGSGHYDVIIEADTGSGKTVQLLYLWYLLGKTTLVIVPKTDLVNQWREKILEFTDIPASRIGIAQQSTCEFEGKSIVIGMIHSVCKGRYSDEFRRYFGIVMFDELHKLGAYHFSKVGGMFPAKYRIGATATLDRADGLEKAFLAHMGNTIIRPKKSEQPIPKVAIYTYPESSGQIPIYYEDPIYRRGVLLSLLAKNSGRTEKVAQLTKTVLDSNRQTLVVSERIFHLEAIHKFLVESGVPKKSIGFYLGATKKSERIRVAKECTCILATMSMLSLGTDIPTLRAIVFATPVSQIAQPVGRIRRINPGLSYPIVIDIYDSFYQECKRWVRSRRKFYDSINCEVNYISG